MARIIKPQEGPQTMFLTTPAEVCVYGGAAGGGKSYGLLLSFLRYKNVKGFGSTIFRRNYNQIFAQGGLWDEAGEVYGGIKGARPRISDGSWIFDDRDGNALSKVKFAHIERDDELANWQGSQICFLGFDELTHFSEKQFFYMLSRNRSTCGVKPFVRATCNPDSDSWVAKFIEWWIDQDTGYPIPERSGKIRWMYRESDQIHWANRKEELWEKFNLVSEADREAPKSVTFIMSSVEDNQELLRVNRGYLANLKALPTVERERLLYGNWKIRPSAGLFFRRSQVTMVSAVPNDIQMWCRAWDIAASEEDKNGDPDYTAGVLMGLRKDRTIIVLDVINQRIKAGEVEKLIYNTSVVDRHQYGFRYKIRIPQDPGAAGKIVADTYVKKLMGFSVRALPISGSKELRANPFATQWQNGNVQVLVADWNDMYFTQLESFPESKHDDMVDASSDAFVELTGSDFNLKNLL
ncbi:MAG: phage terminase large subunit [Lachnospiraceae bacterium]|nr:phage terminase large subunit [Lachnospiraceae bacterium]